MLAAQVTSQRTGSGREVLDAEPAEPVGIGRRDAVLVADHYAGLPIGKELADHVPAESYLAVSYFALISDVFLQLIEGAGVSVPQHVKRSRDCETWWLLQRSALDGKTVHEGD